MANRSSVLDRARDGAKLTIPSILPPDGHSEVTRLTTPYQGIGARGVNNLASKLLLALLPPNAPFFRMVMDDFTMEKIAQREGMRAEVEKAFNKIERAVMSDIETSTIRVSSFEALKQLIVCGNVLCYLPTGGGMKVFRLDRFVVHRDPMGHVLEIIVKETVSPSVLPDGIRDAVSKELGGSVQKSADIYTHIQRKPNQWAVYQECKGIKVPGSQGQYPLDKSPWIPLRWTKIDGEDYGRGYVEEYLGDLRSLEGLTQSIVEGSAAAAKVLFLVNPNGTTQQKTLVDSPNGAVRAGRADDVSVLQVEKFADFRIAFQTIEIIQQRLSYAFLMNSAVQRSGERVTAEEIRYMAGELEDALGGVYSILSQEFQLPLVNRIMFQMERAGKLPPLPRELMKPAITTGLEALGRGHDLNKLQMLLQVLSPLGPEAVSTYLSTGDYIMRAGTSLGIDMAGLVRSEEEVQQMMQAQQQQEMLAQLGPAAMQMAGKMQGAEGQNGPHAQPAEE
jgi:hypothetical protein